MVIFHNNAACGVSVSDDFLWRKKLRGAPFYGSSPQNNLKLTTLKKITAAMGSNTKCATRKFKKVGTFLELC
jgi:hypothetical protein